MSYKVIVQGGTDITPMVETISMRDALDQIAYQASIRLAVSSTQSVPVLTPGTDIRVSGLPFGKNEWVPLLNPGVIWEAESTNSGTKRISLTVYDRMIYLEKSEDEYLFPKDQTATQRLQKYAKDWGIRLADDPTDTKTKLGKAVYRSQTIFSMLFADLKETSKSGGEMYHPRMTNRGLELFKLGSNTKVHELDRLIDVAQMRTLEGAVTKVKVLADAESSSGKEVPSKILTVEEKGTKELGTLQKVVSDDQVKSAKAAKKLAESYLTGIQETFTVTAPDINTIRAGDAVRLGGMKLLVTSASHDLGNPGTMTLELATEESVKRRFYLD
ncbi:phage portal protein [Saccharibacillus sp. CPCC 101409]|uniref:XkdQ/YqbQ family protein n=1 Tax=Saccharibacillus sp. CPCC 101409 TaxID=3058041 RepID=UPI002672588D|nr:phage portal protein [Saccharibacillus sp. CPCC 101409]MDO3408553.1 phage portal protein [Saccharibacillus sp. CPCC 101409]